MKLIEYSDQDIARARAKTKLNELSNCLEWTGAGSKPIFFRSQYKTTLGEPTHYTSVKSIMLWHRGGTINPRDLFYAADKGIPLADVPKLTVTCKNRLCCQIHPLHVVAIATEKPRRRGKPNRHYEITPALMALFDLTLTQEQIDDVLRGPPSLDTYASVVEFLTRVGCTSTDTIDNINMITASLNMASVPIEHFERYMRETF